MMVRNGKYLSLIIGFFWCTASLIAQEVLELKAFTTDLKPLVKAGVGQPFILEVSIKTVTGDLSKPDIMVPAGCVINYSGLNMKTINHVLEMKSTFKARIDAEGVYTLGPARVKHNGKILESETIQIAVGEKQVEVASPHQTKQKQSAPSTMARLSISADRAVMSEQLKGTLRFYTADKTVDFNYISEPDYAQLGWLIKNKSTATTGSEEIDGTVYDYLEWSWYMYPEKAGQLVIPAYRVDYSVAKDQPFNFFNFFMASRIRHQESVYSNALTVTVDPLPAHKKCNAVGRCSNFDMQLDRSLVHEGEGMTLTVSVQTDLDSERINFDLEHMNEHIKVYPSKKYSKDMPQGMKHHFFEYILQPRKSGSFEIPEQSLHYFDVDKRIYRSLTASSIPFEVEQLAAVPQQGAPSQLRGYIQELKDEDEEIKPIMREYMPAVKQRKIPWSFFLLLLLIPLLLLVGRFFWHKLRTFSFSNKWLRTWLLTNALLRKLKKAQRINDVAQIYAIMHDLLASVPQADWQRVLIKSNELPQWSSFYEQIMQARYFKKDSIMRSADLFDQADHWIRVITRRMAQ